MLSYFSNIDPNYFVILGLLLIILETFLSGIGLLFAGLASATTGILIICNIVNNEFYSQLICFSASSVIFVLLLWNPIKRLSKSSNNLKNIVGNFAVVYDEIMSPNKLGKVKWSGTIFNARLESNSVTKIKNDEVEIIEIQGNILIVK